MNKIWKNIDKFSSYAISNMGEVKRIKSGKGTKPGLILKPRKNSWGYLYVILRKDNKDCSEVIHRLVLENFIGINPNKICPNHINGIKTDNRLENLEWTTPSENTKHAYNTGLKKKLYGKNNGHSKLKGKKLHRLTKDDVILIKMTFKEFGNEIILRELSETFGVSQQAICDIKKERNWSYIKI